MNSMHSPAKTEHVRAYLAEIGRRGGTNGRRYLSRQHAKRMVEIREWKRATIKAGKPWPPPGRKARRLLKLDPKQGEPTSTHPCRKRLPIGERVRIPGWY